MKVLVTGGTGYIGGALIPALLERGHEVVALVRKIPTEGAGKVNWVACDLATPLPELPAVDAIFHLAQANVPVPQESETMYAVNTVSTLRLLEHARRCGAQRFLLASTGNVYGWGDRPFVESDPLRPQRLYPTTKVNSENLVRTYQEHFSTAILRIFSPYGPGKAARLIPNLINSVREGRAITLRENGRPHLSPIFIDDLIECLCRLLELKGHHTVNLAGDEHVSLRRIAEVAGELCGREPVFETLDERAAGDLTGDNALMKELSGMNSLLSLREGIARMI
jgi:nucleoside-diphosphate-sugar epimerase